MVASAAPESPMEVMNEPGCFFLLLTWTVCPSALEWSWDEEGFVCYTAENRRARAKLNNLSRALEKRVKVRMGRIDPKWCMLKFPFTGIPMHFSLMWRNVAGQNPALLLLKTLRAMRDGRASVALRRESLQPLPQNKMQITVSKHRESSMKF